MSPYGTAIQYLPSLPFPLASQHRKERSSSPLSNPQLTISVHHSHHMKNQLKEATTLSVDEKRIVDSFAYHLEHTVGVGSGVKGASSRALYTALAHTIKEPLVGTKSYTTGS